MTGCSASSLACCAACKPRYKRLVDSIYPRDPSQGLVKSNIEKLTFYSITHPEKLDRIGEYLVQILSRDVSRPRQRIGPIRVSVEAMDQLLAACHGSPSLNLFVDCFLIIIQRLLETNDPELQLLATNSFVNFANIQEDTPSYHRRYDFFISKFSSLCHSGDNDLQIRWRLRSAGLKGLRGVVRKTASDDLQTNIWEKQHMEKIIPSILFNLHDSHSDPDVFLQNSAPIEGPESPSSHVRLLNTGGDSGEEYPKTLADTCLRELVGKVSFGSMKCVLSPALKHLDAHKLWDPSIDFTINTFRAIMYSIQAQYSYVVIQAVIDHLDSHSNSEASVRTGIASVVWEIVLIAANSIGPGLLEIFNSLLRHLRYSVDYQLSDDCPSVDGEKKFQETLINTMGDFANSLPDYQKVEIMMFIIGKVAQFLDADVNDVNKSDAFLQHVLVKTLLKVATKYKTKTGHLSAVLSSAFLDLLLRLGLVADSEVRLMVQQILHTILDRHDNLDSLEHLECEEDIDQLKLTIEKCSRTDQMFAKKNGTQLLTSLYRAALDFPSSCAKGLRNEAHNLDALCCTMGLLCIELGSDEMLTDLYRLAFAIQSALESDDLQGPVLTEKDKSALHNMVAKYMNLSSHLLAIPALCHHVEKVLKARSHEDRSNFEHQKLQTDSIDLGQDCCDSSSADVDQADIKETALFDRQIFIEALTASGREGVDKLALEFTPPRRDMLTTPIFATDHASMNLSVAGADNTSIGSSPDITRSSSRRTTLREKLGISLDEKAPPREQMTLEKLRALMTKTREQREEEEDQRTIEIMKKMRSTPFGELVEITRKRNQQIREALKDILPPQLRPSPDTQADVLKMELQVLSSR